LRIQGASKRPKIKTNETKCPMGARLRECDKTSETYSAMVGCYVVQFRRSHCMSPSLKYGDVCYYLCSDRLFLYYLVKFSLCYLSIDCSLVNACFESFFKMIWQYCHQAFKFRSFSRLKFEFESFVRNRTFGSPRARNHFDQTAQCLTSSCIVLRSGQS
jgi:hypothetical protein